MLTRLKIHGFRNVRPGTELVFSDRVNILLGRNGTGKTTLLDLLSVVLRGDYAGLRGEAFDIEYEVTNARGSAWVRVGNTLVAEEALPGDPRLAFARGHRSVPSLKAQLSPARAEEALPHKLEVEIQGVTVRLRTDDGEWVNASSVDVFGRAIWLTLLLAFSPRIELAQYTYLATHHWVTSDQAYRFDESLDTFRNIVGGPEVPGGLGLTPPPDVELVGLPPHGSRLVTDRVGGLWPTLRYADPPNAGKASVMVQPAGVKSTLEKFAATTDLGEMNISVSLGASRQGANGVTIWKLGRVEFRFTVNGLSFPHGALSYGQKRLLAFAWYLDANPTYVIADELVNGMHHAWIRFCLDEMADRQAFLTSQNPLLLDYVPITSPEHARKTFISCRSELVDGRLVFVWENLGENDAEDLFQDFQARVQPLGEILRVRGLW